MGNDYLYKIIGMLYVDALNSSERIQSLQHENEQLKTELDESKLDITKALRAMQENANRAKAAASESDSTGG